MSSSIPNLVKPTSSLWFINSGFEILAIVRFAPNCLAKTQAVILEVSEDVTEMNKSEFKIRASFSIEIEVASPFMTFISKWVSA